MSKENTGGKGRKDDETIHISFITEPPSHPSFLSILMSFSLLPPLFLSLLVS